MFRRVKKKYYILLLLPLLVASSLLYTQPAKADLSACEVEGLLSKFSFGFLCPRSAGDSTAVILDGDPDGNSATTPDDYRTIPAARTIQFRTGFDNSNFARQSATDVTRNKVYVFVIIDMNDSDFASSNAVTEGSHSLDGYQIASKSPFGSRGQLQACPGAYGTPVLHSYAGTGPTDNHRSPYAGYGAEVNCGDNFGSDQGRMIWWQLENSHSNKRPRLSFNLTVDDQPLAGNLRKFCVRTYVAVRYDGEPDMSTSPNTSNFDALKRIAKRSNRECFQFQRTFIKGKVRSSAPGSPTSSTNATGVRRPLDPVGAEKVTGCDGREYSIEPDGSFSAAKSRGQFFCLRMPTEIRVRDGDKNNDGIIDTTKYRLKGAFLNGSTYAGSSYENQVAFVHCADRGYQSTASWDTDCNGRQSTDLRGSVSGNINDGYEDYSYDFIYDPIEEMPVQTKSANPVSGPDSNVRPGQRVDFSFTVKNAAEMNIFNTIIEDFIPLNLKPDAVSFDSASIKTTPNAPWNEAGDRWQVEFPNLSCPTFSPSNYLSYGYGGSGVTTGFTCGIENFGGSSRPRIFFSFERMPAYSEITIKWHGFVKSASDIGVYPGYIASPTSGDRRYCATGSPNYSNYGRVPGCEDRSGGHQGVINFSQTRIGGSFAPGYSNITFNPIPGDITGITKSTNARSVAGEQVIGGYPGYDRGDFLMDVTPNTSLGPVEYAVRDQAGANLDSRIDYGGTQSTDAIKYSGTPPDFSNLPDPNERVVWDGADTTAGGFGTKTYRFGYKYNRPNSEPPTGNVTNNAQACFKERWKVGHPEVCRDSNTISLRVVQVTGPFLTTEQGGVQAGSTGKTTCPLTRSTGPRIKNSPGGSGWYVVSTAGNSIIGLGSLAGQSLTGQAYCRPDLTVAANRLRDTNSPNHAIAFASSGSDGFANGAPKVVEALDSYDGANNNAYVVKSGGGDITINNRWTLYVQGDLYIKNNIRYKPTGSALSSTASFGVIATGNIYIDPSVTNLDGYYYAKQKIDTCSRVEGGAVKTLKREVGSGEVGDIGSSECKARLTINGFLMANQFRYNRTTHPGTDASIPAEVAIFSDRLFLATPPAFSDLALTLNPALYGGERRPRY
ncbi:MAG TPA: hypothetical protein VNA68_03575 [Candidatus Dormibacteraeota bacterium]|nr:hypothetical protein [Candidatus Dormibacteraeota bacterium]